jgi:hypothetical protein
MTDTKDCPPIKSRLPCLKTLATGGFCKARRQTIEIFVCAAVTLPSAITVCFYFAIIGAAASSALPPASAPPPAPCSTIFCAAPPSATASRSCLLSLVLEDGNLSHVIDVIDLT